MNNKYLVSICIPTFNRCEYLKKTIESIIQQDGFIQKKVEIVISDNASTDDTEKLCDYYSKKYENISYYKNTDNIGNKNFPLVLWRGEGKLRKLTNDTMMFNEGSIEVLCNIANQYYEDGSFICFSNDKKTLNFKSMDFKSFFRYIGYKITWSGAFSIWDYECKELKDDTFCCESLLWQVRKAYDLASSKNKCLVVDNNLFYVQSVKNKDISYGLYKVFYENFLNIVQIYVDNGFISTKDKMYLEKELLYNFFLGYVLAWEMNITDAKYSDEEDLKKKVFDTYRNKKYFWHFIVKYFQKKIIAKLREMC